MNYMQNRMIVSEMEVGPIERLEAISFRNFYPQYVISPYHTNIVGPQNYLVDSETRFKCIKTQEIQIYCKDVEEITDEKAKVNYYNYDGDQYKSKIKLRHLTTNRDDKKDVLVSAVFQFIKN